jgi:platelet-activating factor acetylhydrolase IB subunit alpha
MKGHKSPVTNMAFHPQFTQLATCSEDGTIKIW